MAGALVLQARADPLVSAARDVAEASAPSAAAPASRGHSRQDGNGTGILFL